MINYMMYMRGSPEDYNEWARVTKDSDWSYKKLLPFFKKMETYQGQFTDGTVTHKICFSDSHHNFI